MANNTQAYIPNDSRLLQLFHYYKGDRFQVRFIPQDVLTPVQLEVVK